MRPHTESTAAYSTVRQAIAKTPALYSRLYPCYGVYTRVATDKPSTPVASTRRAFI